jgi:hypothetical protein
VKVEMTVDWNLLPNEERSDSKPHKRYPKIPASRIDRRLYFIALARHIEEAVDSGQFDSLAAVARACRVSRARVSQVIRKL